MDNNRDSLLFLKFMESKCTNIKTSIDSLLAELCNQLSHSNNQGLKELIYNPHRNRAILESDQRLLRIQQQQNEQPTKRLLTIQERQNQKQNERLL